MKRDGLGRIVKGNTLSPEEKLRQSRGMAEAWKKSPRYIGDIKDVHPRIFNSWRSIRFNEKGKRAGCVDEWADFRTFYNCVVGTYKKGLVLRRKEVLEPWGPENFVWVTPEEAGVMQCRVYLEYNGESHNLHDWSQILQTSFTAIKVRYHKREERGYTTEEILLGRKKNRDSKRAKDISDAGVLIRAKASKMISSYRNKDYKNGFSAGDLTIDWMIENILTKPCVYCGDTYRVGCDRIDNTKGHTKDNVVPCCIECNTARNNYFSYEEMKVLGKTIREIKEKRKEIV